MLVTQKRIQLLATGVVPATALSLADAIQAALPMYQAEQPLICAHFMAQACYETGGFLRFEENLHYTSPARIAAVWPRLTSRAQNLVGNPEALANAAYAGLLGNGDEASGDGWRFRGRGLIQITGRANYVAVGHALGRDLTASPDMLGQPRGAALSALWFWKWHGCNQAAARDDAVAVTTLINGKAREGLAQRINLTQKAKEIFT